MKGIVRSMTGFGRDETESEGRRYTVEIKTVNHRFLDVNIKMPKVISKFESSIRSLAKEYLERGKVDIYVTFYDRSFETACVHYNKGIAAEYMKYLKEIVSDFGLDDDIRASTLARFPEVFTTEEAQVDEDVIWNEFKPVLEKALSDTRVSREREGENLRTDLLSKLEEMHSIVKIIEDRSPDIVKNYREKLMDKVQDMLGDAEVDMSRIITEVTIFSDRVCVDEEITRLKSHIDTFISDLKNGGAIGRRLDFIAQEMNREANTILSKANDIITSDTAIDLKTGIEKVREQIQNIE